MTKEEFDIITNKIGCWFTHLKLNSFRKTFDGEVYPSSALGTDYDLFIHKLEKELLFEDNHSLPSDLDEAAEKLASDIAPDYPDIGWDACFEKIKEGIKAGAKWMAGQGVNSEGKVFTSAFTSYVKTPGIEELLKDAFPEDTEVIVQVRKKE